MKRNIARMAFPTPYIGHLEAYANNFSALIPVLYEVIDMISRELVGMIPSVARDVSAERIAFGQTITWHRSNTIASVPIEITMTPTAAADRTVVMDTMTIDKGAQVEFNMTGEEQKALGTSIGVQALYNSELAEALRTLCNATELDLANEGYRHASRATGTPGTTPFANAALDPLSDIVQILDDNGAPGARSAVINSVSANKMRVIPNLTRVNEAGSSMTLRQGELLDIFGLSVKQTAQFKGHTKGTGASATTSGAAIAVGATTIPLASAGTGTIVAGDVITFAGDANKYVVVTGDTDVSNGGSLTIARPGLMQAVPAAATAITLANSYRQNLGFSQDAIRLVQRAPAKPSEGDLRIEEYVLTDPRSGLSFEFAVWPGVRMVKYTVAAVWGVKAVKPEHIALLMG